MTCITHSEVERSNINRKRLHRAQTQNAVYGLLNTALENKDFHVTIQSEQVIVTYIFIAFRAKWLGCRRNHTRSSRGTATARCRHPTSRCSTCRTSAAHLTPCPSSTSASAASQMYFHYRTSNVTCRHRGPKRMLRSGYREASLQCTYYLCHLAPMLRQLYFSLLSVRFLCVCVRYARIRCSDIILTP